MAAMFFCKESTPRKGLRAEKPMHEVRLHDRTKNCGFLIPGLPSWGVLVRRI